MTMISSSDVTNMKAAQELVMLDKGYRQIPTSARNTLGEETLTFAREGSEISCGIEMKEHGERSIGMATLVEYDAVIRVPVDFEITEKDRFEVTSFRGVDFSFVFEVVAPVRKGISCNRIYVNKVEI